MNVRKGEGEGIRLKSEQRKLKLKLTNLLYPIAIKFIRKNENEIKYFIVNFTVFYFHELPL